MSQILNDLLHDGTGQNARMSAALSPNFFQLDERRPADMQQYARELSYLIRYFDFEGQDAGNWHLFLRDARGLISDQDILKYQNDPTAFAHDLYRLAWLSRPHFVLFLTFLALLDRVRQDVNRFTERHLDHYYRPLLGFTPRSPEADFVYLIAEIAQQTPNYRLLKNTLLKAGKDDDGKNRSFSTTEEIIVNKTQIAELRTVVMDTMRLSIADYYKKLTIEPFLGLINWIYAHPTDVNGALKSFSAPSLTLSTAANITKYAKEVLAFLTKEMSLPLSEIRKLLALRQRVTTDTPDWQIINDILRTAGRLKKQQANWEPNPSLNSRDFVGRFTEIYAFDPLNLLRDPNNPFQKDFQGVEDIFDFAEQVEEQLKLRQDNNPLFDAEKLEKFRVFIQTTLSMPVTTSATATTVFETNFRQMMRRLAVIKKDWAKVNRLIKKAGTTKRQTDFAPNWIDLPLFSTDLTKHLPDVESRLRAALSLGEPLFNFSFLATGSPTPIKLNTLDQFLSQLTALQEWFFLPYEDVFVLLNTTQEPPEGQSLIFALLEKAWYKKQAVINPTVVPPIAPIKMFFNGFFAQTDATKNTNTQSETTAWNTLGVVNDHSPAEIGFAIQSDLLLLSEGTRTITLTLNLIKTDGQVFALQNPSANASLFNYTLSTKKEWAETQGVITNGNTITITLPPTFPAVEPPKAGLFLGDPDVPVLKITLKNPNAATSDDKHPFTLLKEAQLKNVKLSVSVTDLTPTAAENDNNTLNLKKAFQPFGTTPTPNSVFLFGHRELFKPLIKIGAKYTWKGIVGDTLVNHYKNYGKATEYFDAASAKLSCWNKKVREPNPSTDTDSVTLFKGNSFETSSLKIASPPDVSMPDVLSDWTRYFRLRLTLDLLHNSFASIASQKAMQFAIDLKTPPPSFSADNYKLNPPYTPEWSAFKVDYTSDTVVLFDIDSKLNTGACAHLLPFGHLALQAEDNIDKTKLLPTSFLPQFTEGGALFMGFKDCLPPQQIALLFVLAEGSAHPDLEKPDVSWGYLTEKGWKTLKAQHILLEQTAGLSNSGIVKLALPADASNTSTLMPLGFHWIKASVPFNRESVCDTFQIHTQAVGAIRVLDTNSTDDPGRPLPPNTINGFYERQSGIRKISQPYPSFGGKSAESTLSFLPRVSERLRHRERALTTWDVERLLLAHFPDVFKAKCLPVAQNDGEVVVVLIPDIRGKELYDAFKPKMPVNRLREMGRFLDKHGSPLAHFRPTNPVYVELRVKAFVQFYAGLDVSFYLALLEEDLKRFLAPWAYDEGADIVLNSTIYPSVIVNFMEERPYVDYVTEVTLFKREEGKIEFSPPVALGRLQPDRPESVWVSAQQHFIDPVVIQADNTVAVFSGIGYMQVEYDFIII